MKDSNERLLDMLEGWERVANRHPDYSTQEIDAVSDLYQEAGQNAMTDDDVKKFLLEKVFSVLCNGVQR